MKQSREGIIHGIGVPALGQTLGAQLVEGRFCQLILSGGHRQLAACGQIVHTQDKPPGHFGASAVSALAVVDIAQCAEQDAFVRTVKFYFTFCHWFCASFCSQHIIELPQ